MRSQTSIGWCKRKHRTSNGWRSVGRLLYSQLWPWPAQPSRMRSACRLDCAAWQSKTVGGSNAGERVCNAVLDACRTFLIFRGVVANCLVGDCAFNTAR